MIRLLIIIILILLCFACTDKTQSIGKGVEYGAKALACNAVGINLCTGIAVVDGYIKGEKETLNNKKNRLNEKFIKKMADKQAEIQGVNVKDCRFFGLICK